MRQDLFDEMAPRQGRGGSGEGRSGRRALGAAMIGAFRTLLANLRSRRSRTSAPRHPADEPAPDRAAEAFGPPAARRHTSRLAASWSLDRETGRLVCTWSEDPEIRDEGGSVAAPRQEAEPDTARLAA